MGFKKANTSFKIILSSLVLTLISSYMLADLLRIRHVDAILDSLPAPSQLLETSNMFEMPLLKGIKLDPKNPLKIDFILDHGDQENIDSKASAKLVNYFLAALTVPQDNFWVNLSPYEKDRVIEDRLGITDLGKDMLAQDYILKQMMSSLTYPEKGVGKEYWTKINQELLTDLKNRKSNIDTFNKVWITPGNVEVYEYETSAIITVAQLKVMLEDDYHAKTKSSINKMHTKIDELSSQTLRDIVIPEIEDEVNYGQHFAPLRQFYHSLILALWFKEKFAKSFYSNYIDQAKINGIDIEDKEAKTKIFSRYKEAFEKGVYDYVKKETVPGSRRKIAKRYFSGGEYFGKEVLDISSSTVTVDNDTMQEAVREQASGSTSLVSVALDSFNNVVKSKLGNIMLASLVLFSLVNPSNAGIAYLNNDLNRISKLRRKLDFSSGENISDGNGADSKITSSPLISMAMNKIFKVMLPIIMITALFNPSFADTITNIQLSSKSIVERQNDGVEKVLRTNLDTKKNEIIDTNTTNGQSLRLPSVGQVYDAYMTHSNLPESIENIKADIKLNPQSGELWNLLGHAYYQKSKLANSNRSRWDLYDKAIQSWVQEQKNSQSDGFPETYKSPNVSRRIFIRILQIANGIISLEFSSEELLLPYEIAQTVPQLDSVNRSVQEVYSKSEKLEEAIEAIKAIPELESEIEEIKSLMPDAATINEYISRVSNELFSENPNMDIMNRNLEFIHEYMKSAQEIIKIDDKLQAGPGTSYAADDVIQITQDINKLLDLVDMFGVSENSSELSPAMASVDVATENLKAGSDLNPVFVEQVDLNSDSVALLEEEISYIKDHLPTKSEVRELILQVRRELSSSNPDNQSIDNHIESLKLYLTNTDTVLELDEKLSNIQGVSGTADDIIILRSSINQLLLDVINDSINRQSKKLGGIDIAEIDINVIGNGLPISFIEAPFDMDSFSGFVFKIVSQNKVTSQEQLLAFLP